jgi:hypothetical protein
MPMWVSLEMIKRRTAMESEKVLELVIKQFGRPEGYSHSKVFNVFENYWRVNMYSKAANEKECFINKLFIAKSFFVNVGKKGDLNIL